MSDDRQTNFLSINTLRIIHFYTLVHATIEKFIYAALTISVKRRFAFLRRKLSTPSSHPKDYFSS